MQAVAIILAGLAFYFIGSGFDTATAENGLEEAERVCQEHRGIQQAQLSTLLTADYVVCHDGHVDSLD